MAEKRLSGKKDGLFAFGGSLALRILFVFFFTLIIPLIFHFFTMSRRDYRLRLNQLILELDIISKVSDCSLQKMIFLQERGLNTIKAFPPFDAVVTEKIPDSQVNNLFAKITADQDLSTLFYLGKNSNGGYTVLASNNPERVGTQSIAEQHFLSPENFESLLEEGILFYLGQDPWTDLKQLYLSIPIYDPSTGALLGVLTSGVDAEELIYEMEGEDQIDHPFDLALLTSDGKIFVTTNPYLSLDNLVIFSGEKLSEDPSQLLLLKKLRGSTKVFADKEGHIGLKIPIQGAQFYLLVEVPERFIDNLQKRDNFIRFLSLFLFIIIIGGALTFWLTFRMSKPLKQLSDLMGKVGGGTFDVRYEKDAMGFELNRLGDRFNEMEDQLSQYIEAVKIERVAKERFASELQIGRDIQEKILPQKMPDFPGLDIASGFTPAKEVGGDFFDLYVKKDVEPNQLVVAIADASGKGISACFYSLCLRSMLRSYDATHSELPQIIRSTNNLFCLDTGETGMFVTAWVGIYDPSTKLMRFSSCGHHPAVVKRKNGALEEITTPGIALGVAPFDKVKDDSVQLQSGDWVILYTDGILEAHDQENNLFGKERLFQLLRESSDQNAQALVDRITAAVLEFSHESVLFDDITLLVLRVL